MASSVEEITIAYEEDGVLLVEELDKAILSRCAWATILFKYRQLDKAAGHFGPTLFSIRRYQKSGGEYRQKSKFNISSLDQAQKIIEVLSGWIREG